MTGPVRRWAAAAVETLDERAPDAALLRSALSDLARINPLLGLTAAVARRLDEFLRPLAPGTELTLLDVGTGAGDIPRALAARAARRGVRVRCIGLERLAGAARQAALGGGVAAVVADGGALPLRAGAVDVVLCVKVLHHLPGEPGRAVLRELDRVARLGVIVSDIRRSALAAAGLWLISWPLGLHPATRRDGVISVFRGFSAAELGARCAEAGVRARVRRHPLWCLTAAWRPSGAAA